MDGKFHNHIDSEVSDDDSSPPATQEHASLTIKPNPLVMLMDVILG